jgi:hypothetical protein
VTASFRLFFRPAPERVHRGLADLNLENPMSRRVLSACALLACAAPLGGCPQPAERSPVLQTWDGEPTNTPSVAGASEGPAENPYPVQVYFNDAAPPPETPPAPPPAANVTAETPGVLEGALEGPIREVLQDPNNPKEGNFIGAEPVRVERDATGRPIRVTVIGFIFGVREDVEIGAVGDVQAFSGDFDYEEGSIHATGPYSLAVTLAEVQLEATHWRVAFDVDLLMQLGNERITAQGRFVFSGDPGDATINHARVETHYDWILKNVEFDLEPLWVERWQTLEGTLYYVEP